MPAMVKKPDLPMPLAPFRDCPTLQTAPGTVYRAVGILCMAYWQAGCALPSRDEVTLAALCRLPQQHVSPIKSLILRALDEIRPELDREHARQMKAHQHRAAAAQHMRDGKNSRQTVRELQKGIGQSAQTPLPLPQRATLTPRMEARADMPSRSRNPARVSASFTD